MTTMYSPLPEISPHPRLIVKSSTGDWKGSKETSVITLGDSFLSLRVLLFCWDHVWLPTLGDSTEDFQRQDSTLCFEAISVLLSIDEPCMVGHVFRQQDLRNSGYRAVRV